MLSFIPLIFTTLFLLPSSFAFPPSSPLLASRGEDDPVFQVWNFIEYIQNASNSSSVAFHVEDTRRGGHLASVDCSASGTLYRPSYTNCTPTEGYKDAGISFKLSEGELVVRRHELLEGGSYITWVAPQGTYWMEGENMTTTQDGKTYTRASQWLFPATSASAS